MNLVLGSFQLGTNYGIANKTGKPEFDSVLKIISSAWEGGITQIDTAQIYGDSETTLGIAMENLGLLNKINIITKLDPKINCTDTNKIKIAANKSIENLKIDQIYCLMLHDENLIDKLNDGLEKLLLEFKEIGLTKYIGISVYSPERAMQALRLNIFDAVQIPSNAIDRRFEKKNIFQFAKTQKKLLYVRSIFLQGLLLLTKNNYPKKMNYAYDEIIKFKKISDKYKISQRELALYFVKLAYPDSYILFGAENNIQVIENIKLWKNEAPSQIVEDLKKTFQNVDSKILNVTLWPKN